MEDKEIDEVFNRYAKSIMIQWSLKGFKRVFPRLYRVILLTVKECVYMHKPI